MHTYILEDSYIFEFFFVQLDFLSIAQEGCFSTLAVTDRFSFRGRFWKAHAKLERHFKGKRDTGLTLFHVLSFLFLAVHSCIQNLILSHELA